MEDAVSGGHVATDFVELVRLEPRLGKLLAQCRAAAPPTNEDDDTEDCDADDATWCFEDFFFVVIKPQLLDLVGWLRAEGPPLLRSERAYLIAYRTLYGALPWTCECCRSRDA